MTPVFKSLSSLLCHHQDSRWHQSQIVQRVLVVFRCEHFLREIRHQLNLTRDPVSSKEKNCFKKFRDVCIQFLPVHLHIESDGGQRLLGSEGVNDGLAVGLSDLQSRLAVVFLRS